MERITIYKVVFTHGDVVASSPPPRYSNVPSSTRSPAQFAGSSGDKRHVSELPAVTPPVELDASEATTDYNRHWTQSLAENEAIQLGGLGISSVSSSPRFSS